MKHLHLVPNPLYCVGVVLLLLSLLVSGCTKQTADPRSLTSLVSIEGSDTMAVLLNSWKDGFMKDNPEIPVSLTIVDSGAGIRALIEQNTDVAASSRDLTNQENDQFHKKNVHLVRRIVALDSIAVIVNPACELTEISMTDLRNLFTGSVSKWSDVGGKSANPVVVCIRESDSGTSRYFNEHVLKKPTTEKTETPINYVNSAKIFNNNEALIAAVQQDKNAIGYIGLSYAVDAKGKVKILKVKLLDKSAAVMPSLRATTDDYSLSRPLYMFFDTKAKPSTKKFVDFCLSEAGQKIVKDHGFVSLN